MRGRPAAAGMARETEWYGHGLGCFSHSYEITGLAKAGSLMQILFPKCEPLLPPNGQNRGKTAGAATVCSSESQGPRPFSLVF